LENVVDPGIFVAGHVSDFDMYDFVHEWFESSFGHFKDEILGFAGESGITFYNNKMIHMII